MILAANQPIFETIANYFRHLISISVLKPGDALPSVREVAVSEKVNPNTVVRAYGLLQDEGLITSVPKKGYFVSEHGAIQEVTLLEKALSNLMELGYSAQDIINTANKLGGKQ